MTSRQVGRPPRYRETVDLVQATRRLVNAIGRRAADEDPELIAHLLQVRFLVDKVTAEAVRRQRSRGATWESIGQAVGTTRQAAIMRWGDK